MPTTPVSTWSVTPADIHRASSVLSTEADALGAMTVQLAIGQLMGSLGVINWGGIMACGVIVTIPVIVLFGCIQRYLIEGLTAGAVKG